VFFSINFGVGQERDYLIENLSTLISSGMGISEALEAIEADLRSKSMRRIVRKIQDSVESGFPLWRALQSSRLFSAHTVSLLRIGEESGKLSENLRVASAEQEKERLFRSKIRSAMMYPVFVLTLTVIIGLSIFLVCFAKACACFFTTQNTIALITKILIRHRHLFLERMAQWPYQHF